jgi:hypothetical protein
MLFSGCIPKQLSIQTLRSALAGTELSHSTQASCRVCIYGNNRDSVASVVQFLSRLKRHTLKKTIQAFGQTGEGLKGIKLSSLRARASILSGLAFARRADRERDQAVD